MKTMFPIWAKINHEFDQERMKQELLANDIFGKSMVATTNYNDQGNSVWDPEGTAFPEEIFEKQKYIDHYISDGAERKLVKGQYNTFRMLNLTYLPENAKSSQDAWEGKLETNDRLPLWVKYPTPWSWREDLNIPYTRSIIEALPIEYPLTVRCVIQDPPSIGVVHKDSGPKTNETFFSKGFGSITLNVSDGGAHLWFINHRTGEKFAVDESKHKCWHFDDACIHCTTEVFSKRIQLRIFAKLKKPYREFLAKEGIIF